MVDGATVTRELTVVVEATDVVATAVATGAAVVAVVAVVTGGEVVGAAVAGAAVVGAAVVGAAVGGAAADRVTAMAYVMVGLPDTELTAKEIFSVAPSATVRTSVSDDIAIVPDPLVRLIAAPDALAIAVKVSDTEALGIVSE